MKIYHGSNVIVQQPEIRRSERFVDFGFGFYTTTSLEQAKKWAHKIKLRTNSSVAYVSEYEFDFQKAQKDLKIIEFKGPTREWLNFVCINRKGECMEEYDIASGPVADDNVYQVVRLFELGAYDMKDTIKRLRVEKLFDQILFHTTKAISYLKFYSHTEVI